MTIRPISKHPPSLLMLPWFAFCTFYFVCCFPVRYNCHVVVSSAGDIVASYRKVHLFDVDVPNGPVLMESRTTAPGSEVRTASM
jgi:predicted amidohydrolase